MPRNAPVSEDEQSAKAIGAQGRKMVRALVPEFVNAVSRARKDGLSVELSIAGLGLSPEILFLCIWYASDREVPVTFVPWARPLATSPGEGAVRRPRRARTED
jgi:hypothetical protein